jgi:hypothetical protein
MEHKIIFTTDLPFPAEMHLNTSYDEFQFYGRFACVSLKSWKLMTILSAQFHEEFKSGHANNIRLAPQHYFNSF